MREPIWEMQEAAIVHDKLDDNHWLTKTRDERQDQVYAYYAKLKIYTASQTIDLIDRFDLWPIPGEDEWGEFVDRVYRRAEIDDTERRARASQSLAEADNAQGLQQHQEIFGDTSCVSYVSGGLS